MKSKLQPGRSTSSERSLGCLSLSLWPHHLSEREEIGLRSQGRTRKQTVLRRKQTLPNLEKQNCIVRRREGLLTHQGHSFEEFDPHHLLLFLAPHLKALPWEGRAGGGERSSDMSITTWELFLPFSSLFTAPFPPTQPPLTVQALAVRPTIYSWGSALLWVFRLEHTPLHQSHYSLTRDEPGMLQISLLLWLNLHNLQSK